MLWNTNMLVKIIYVKLYYIVGSSYADKVNYANADDYAHLFWVGR